MFGDIVAKLHRSRELLIQSASISEFRNAETARLFTTSKFEAQRERDEKDQRLSVINWLSHVSCQVQHEELQGRRRMYPKTTRWIFGTPLVCEWFRHDDNRCPILCVYGRPGAGALGLSDINLNRFGILISRYLGKTFLFNSIIDEIGAKVPGSQVVYFYCKEADPLRRTFNGIARSLIGQILALNPVCLNYLYERTVKSGERTPTSIHLCTDILKNLAANHDQLFIGIDGLDECEESERGRILALIYSILDVSNVKSNVKILLTTRKEKDIRQSIRSALQLEIEPHHIEKDMIYYIDLRVSELGLKFSLPIEEKKRIAREIATRSKGR